FLETIYSAGALDQDLAEVQFRRLDALMAKTGRVLDVSGDWKNMPAYFTVQAPLIPFASQARGQGFATFSPDQDEVFRRQNLISKISKVIDEVELSQLQPDSSDYEKQYQRYVYTDRSGEKVTLPAPLTAEVIKTLPELLAKNA